MLPSLRFGRTTVPIHHFASPHIEILLQEKASQTDTPGEGIDWSEAEVKEGEVGRAYLLSLLHFLATSTSLPSSSQARTLVVPFRCLRSFRDFKVFPSHVPLRSTARPLYFLSYSLLLRPSLLVAGGSQLKKTIERPELITSVPPISSRFFIWVWCGHFYIFFSDVHSFLCASISDRFQ